MTISRWIGILATILVAGGVAWLLKLTVVAFQVATTGRAMESAAVAFFYLTGLGFLFIGSTALGLWLTRSRPVPLRLAAVVLSPIVFWGSYQIMDVIVDSIVGDQAPGLVESETAILLAALVWLAIGAMVLKSTRRTPTPRVG